MKQYLLSFLCLTFLNIAFGQYHQLSEHAEISVLTIGPGTSLNDSFGHSAYRIKDDAIDIVFNYGVYDFDTPNFYTKFAQGKLNYKIGANYFLDFKANYIRQNRTIKEQILDLSQEQKQQIFNFLSENYEPENQYYLYDFFYDNCATKIKDVLKDGLDNNIHFNNPENFEAKTFRSLIQDNLHWNSWGSFGIDLALGSIIDIKATPEEHMFLPENIYRFFKSATLTNDIEKKLVKREQIIFKKLDNNSSKGFLTSPFIIMLIIALLILYRTFVDYKKEKRSKWLDVSIFMFTGVIGIILLLLWFATDHGGTANNYNLLWAFALNLFVLGQVIKSKPSVWFKKYIIFLILMLCLLTLHWLIGVQQFALALIPFLIALAMRYLYLNFYFKRI